MDIAAMVVVVLVLTQFIKGILKDWRLNIKGKGAMVLSFLCSICVVLYFQISAGVPISFTTLWIVLQVFVLANGGKKLISSARPK